MFFLGLHRYLIDYVDSNVFQFLFIDQPSIPYYVGNAEVNSNDEDKLKDAFRVINAFMDYVVNSKKKTSKSFLLNMLLKVIGKVKMDFLILRHVTSFWMVKR